jgi:hypothetical protein
MIVIMDNGKMNTLGKIEYGAVMRHRNPLLCTMGHTAFYLFYRWNIAGEPPALFSTAPAVVRPIPYGRRLSEADIV